jgi:hypothetical protein
MTSLLPLLDLVQESVGSSPVGTPSPFSIFQLGKSLFTIPFFTLVTVIITGRGVWRLKRGGPSQLPLARSTIDLGLFWGALTFGAGLFHTFMSLISTAQSVQLYGPIGPEQQWLVARGVMLALMAGAAGLLVFLVAALAWRVLRRWHRQALLTTA